MLDGYFSLFLVAFLAATVLPAYSEVLFAGLLAGGYDALALWAWAPTGGDALTFIAGFLRVRFDLFLLLTALGKGARYAILLGLVEGLGAIWTPTRNSRTDDRGPAAISTAAIYNIHRSMGGDGRRDPARVARAIHLPSLARLIYPSMA
jgi:membrane protein DedA with SNARE-associated domain